MSFDSFTKEDDAASMYTDIGSAAFNVVSKGVNLIPRRPEEQLYLAVEGTKWLVVSSDLKDSIKTFLFKVMHSVTFERNRLTFTYIDEDKESKLYVRQLPPINFFFLKFTQGRSDYWSQSTLRYQFPLELVASCFCQFMPTYAIMWMTSSHSFRYIFVFDDESEGAAFKAMLPEKVLSQVASQVESALVAEALGGSGGGSHSASLKSTVSTDDDIYESKKVAAAKATGDHSHLTKNRRERHEIDSKIVYKGNMIVYQNTRTGGQEKIGYCYGQLRRRAADFRPTFFFEFVKLPKKSTGTSEAEIATLFKQAAWKRLVMCPYAREHGSKPSTCVDFVDDYMFEISEFQSYSGHEDQNDDGSFQIWPQKPHSDHAKRTPRREKFKWLQHIKEAFAEMTGDLQGRPKEMSRATADSTVVFQEGFLRHPLHVKKRNEKDPAGATIDRNFAKFEGGIENAVYGKKASPSKFRMNYDERLLELLVERHGTDMFAVLRYRNDEKSPLIKGFIDLGNLGSGRLRASSCVPPTAPGQQEIKRGQKGQMVPSKEGTLEVTTEDRRKGGKPRKYTFKVPGTLAGVRFYESVMEYANDVNVKQLKRITAIKSTPLSGPSSSGGDGGGGGGAALAAPAAPASASAYQNIDIPPALPQKGVSPTSGGSGGSSATAPAKAAVAAAPFAVPAAQLKKTNKLVAKSALDNLVRSCNPRIIQDIFKDDLEFNGTVTCVGHHPGLGLQAAERLLESLLNVSGDFLTWDSGGSSPMAGIAACGVRVGQALPAQKKVRTRPNGGKFVGKIELGKPVQAALGLADLMGHTTMSIMQLINAHGGDGVRAIKQEIADHGSDDDKMNLRCLLDGTYVNPPHEDGTDPTPLEIAARSQTIETLMTMHQVTTAKLEAAHVLALRLYTTTSHKSINAPLRDTGSTHPLAATTYYISEGLKKLRAVEASSPDANTPKTFWRGLKNREIGSEFISKGGCEFGCMSTSAFKNVAVEFALSTVPFLFQIETKDFLQRGADISFLSVYPDEQEMLYPPLMFLRSLRTAPTIEKIDGYHVQIVVVEPQFPT